MIRYVPSAARRRPARRHERRARHAIATSGTTAPVTSRAVPTIEPVAGPTIWPAHAGAAASAATKRRTDACLTRIARPRGRRRFYRGSVTSGRTIKQVRIPCAAPSCAGGRPAQVMTNDRFHKAFLLALVIACTVAFLLHAPHVSDDDPGRRDLFGVGLSALRVSVARAWAAGRSRRP